METDSVWSVIIVITTSDDRDAGVRFIIVSMITHRIGQHEVLLLVISHNNYNFRKKNISLREYLKLS